jgi:CBS domain-containing protein
MKAREVMSSSVETVTREDSLTRAAQLMKQADVGAIPVVESQDSMRLVGLITDRDIAVRHVAGDNADDCKVGDHMTEGRLFTCSPDDELETVMKTMKTEQVRRVPVVEGDRLVGIIAQADIATEDVDDAKTGEVVERISEPNR